LLTLEAPSLELFRRIYLKIGSDFQLRVLEHEVRDVGEVIPDPGGVVD
jgi:hypothetical protein